MIPLSLTSIIFPKTSYWFIVRIDSIDNDFPSTMIRLFGIYLIPFLLCSFGIKWTGDYFPLLIIFGSLITIVNIALILINMGSLFDECDYNILSFAIPCN